MTEAVYVIKHMLGSDEVSKLLAELENAEYAEGAATAQGMAQAVKKNEQVVDAEASALLEGVRNKLAASRQFIQLTLARRIGSLMISRYRVGMEYGSHTDAAILNSGLRADISFTLFLSDPSSYVGGALAMETPFGEQQLRLPAGTLALYPTGTLHRVTPVTEGERIAIVGWIESRIRDDRKRQILHDLDMARSAYLEKVGHDRNADLLFKSSMNLRRMWDE